MNPAQNARTMLRIDTTVRYGWLAAVVLFASLLIWHFHDRFWWPPDDGAYAHVADRILAGEVLNRDVSDVHTGYVHFVNAAALHLFGNRLLSLRYPLAVLGVLQAALVWVTMSRRAPAGGAIAAAALTCFSFIQFLNPTANWYCLFFLVLTVLALTHIPRGNRFRLFAVGLALGMMFGFRQLTGAISALGVVGYLLAEPGESRQQQPNVWLARITCAVMLAGLAFYIWKKTTLWSAVVIGIWPLALLAWTALRTPAGTRETARILSQVGIGAVVAQLPLAVYHAMHGSIGPWLNDTVVRAVGLTELNFMSTAGYWRLVPQGAAHAVSTGNITGVANGVYWIILPLLPAVLGTWMLLRLVWNKPAQSSGTPVAVWPFVGVFYALVTAHYEIPIYLYYGIGVVVVALLVLAWQQARGVRLCAAGVACTLALVAVVYHAGQPVSRGREGTIKGQRVELGDSTGIDRCGLRIESRDLILYRRLIDVVNRQTGQDDSILVVPFNPELYYLTGRRNPLPFYNTGIGIRCEDETGAVIAKLRDDPPKLVFYCPDDKYNTASSERLMEFVKQRYHILLHRDGFEIYRYGPAPADDRPSDAALELLDRLRRPRQER